MKTTPPVGPDERAVAVENASYKWGYFFLSFAVLIDATYRSIVRHEAPMDLLALFIVGGAICTIYQARHKALPAQWLTIFLICGVSGGILAVILVLLKTLG